MEKIRHIKLNSREEYKLFLKSLFNSLDCDREYNIFVHQINNYFDYEYIKFRNPEKVKLSQIIKQGLFLSNYSSICGTTRMIGSTKNIDIDQIIDYEYYEQMENRIVCLFVLPKYVEIDGEHLEFSSFNDDCGYTNEELKKAYQEQNLFPDSHHFKSSLFDVIKNYDRMPKCFFLGAHLLRKNDKHFNFLINYGHISFLDKDEKKSIYENIQAKVLKEFENYGTKETKHLIVQSYTKEQKWRDKQLEFEV